MTYIATPIDRMSEQYDVVVVGSGYGGAISASRLARAELKVCLLERGDERQPGDFPESSLEGMREIQMDWPNRRMGAHNALYDFHVNPDISVLVGCGLGGTSLINANVAIMPDERVWLDPKWPDAIRADRETRIAQGVARAVEMLRPTPFPEHLPTPHKLQAMDRSAKHMKVPFFRPSITVNFEDGTNHVGLEQLACNSCGNCVGGCNRGSKNTLLMNYLPDANNHGAEIFTGTSVKRLERKGKRWLVRFEATNSGLRKFGVSSMFVTAETVVLAAGSLGSTEILLRSRDAGLSMSDKVGHRFTGNGDVLGFAYNAKQLINGIGVGSARPGTGPGPCITGLIDLRDTPLLEDAMIIEEGVIPSTLAPTLALSLFTAARMLGHYTTARLQEYTEERMREMEALIPGHQHRRRGEHADVPRDGPRRLLRKDRARGRSHAHPLARLRQAIDLRADQRRAQARFRRTRGHVHQKPIVDGTTRQEPRHCSSVGWMQHERDRRAWRGGRSRPRVRRYVRVGDTSRALRLRRIRDAALARRESVPDHLRTG